MSAPENALPSQKASTTGILRKSHLRDALACLRAGEFVFGVIGYAGSGTSHTADQIYQLLTNQLASQGVKIHKIKARELLDRHIDACGAKKPSGSSLEMVSAYQEAGDELRKSSQEYGAVGAYAILNISELRSGAGQDICVYIIDSIKHPAEVELLRAVYGDAFCLVGVGCRPDVRQARLARKHKLASDAAELQAFVARDAEDSEHKYGQQVNDTYHLSDYFVDNTSDSAAPKTYVLSDQIKRLFDILFTQSIHRPTSSERGMYHAHAASMRSSCLSRQVGAAILELTRFRGHLNVRYGGVYGGQVGTVHAGVQAADGGLGQGRA